MSQTPKQQPSREGEHRDETSNKQCGQPKISRTGGRPLCEVVFIDPHRSKKRTVNAKESVSAAPISLRDAITNLSLQFQNTIGRSVAPERGAKDNSSRNRSNNRKSRRQRLEISSRVDSQRTQKSPVFGKPNPRQISREMMAPLQGSQLLNRIPRRVRDGDHNLYQQAALLAGSLEELPQEGGTYLSSGRHQALMEHGKADDSTRSVYPAISPVLLGRSPSPNIRDFPRAVFPLPGFSPGFGGIPPGFYLPPQAASGTGAPPGFYLPLQATPGNGMSPGFMPHGFCPPPGFSAVPRFYPPSLVATGISTPPAIYPFSQAALGTSTSLGYLPRPQTLLGTGAPYGLYSPPQSVLGPGASPRFYPPAYPTLGTSPMLSTSQQPLGHEKSDQTSVAPQPITPSTEPPVSSEIFGSMLSASTSAATTALPPTLPAGSPPQVPFILNHS
ncbi:extensin [Loa loa]|uniref:Extensin n=1 Tax=Loa loa TaxID=7209 RepID=A0A1I7W4Y7_LOALO|nr:extensin [Loa loa]EJD75485.1 extensin [Loa loa]